MCTQPCVNGEWSSFGIVCEDSKGSPDLSLQHQFGEKACGLFLLTTVCVSVILFEAACMVRPSIMRLLMSPICQESSHGSRHTTCSRAFDEECGF